MTGWTIWASVLSILLASVTASIVGSKKRNVCYFCATDFMVWHWSRFIPPSQTHSAPTSDNKCKNESLIYGSSTSPMTNCNGPCFTLNVTGVATTGHKVVVGVVRGCQSAFFNEQIDFDGKTEVTKTEAKRLSVNGQRLNVDVHWSYCNSDYCNGPKSLYAGSSVTEHRVNRKRRPLRHRNAAIKTPYDFYCLPMFLFVGFYARFFAV